LSQATDPLFRAFAFRNIQLDGDEVGVSRPGRCSPSPSQNRT
jgi:hypothetical protein